MSELRYNPLLGTWTMVAANRQKRPHLPKDYCPFCPGNGKLPDSFDALLYPNDFPVLSEKANKVSNADLAFKRAEAYGACELILYSDDHYKQLHQLSSKQLIKLIGLWKQRFDHHSQNDRIKFVHIFENKGEEVGVTIHHPHGQLYAYPFLPLKIEQELLNCQKRFKEKQKCLLCEQQQAEIANGARIIFEDEAFVSFIPFYSDYPYGVHIGSKKHLNNLSAFGSSEIQSLAQHLSKITKAFYRLFDKEFPYMMSLHQLPVDCNKFKHADQFYHFHIEFYTPLRAADKIKWNASSETGAWAAANTLLVEDCAKVLRELIKEL